VTVSIAEKRKFKMARTWMHLSWAALAALSLLLGVAHAQETSQWKVIENASRQGVVAVAESHMSLGGPQTIVVSFGCMSSSWVALYRSSLRLMPQAKVSFSAFNSIDSKDAAGKTKSDLRSFSADLIADADGDLTLTEAEAIRFADFIASVSDRGAAVILKSAASDDARMGFIPGDSRKALETVYRECGRKYGMKKVGAR
jgi:hypothetical protein